MSKRNYNVFFNAHTVSGIVISVALYIIFFAGAFALFKNEIAIWEEGSPINNIDRTAIDYDKIISTLDCKYDLQGRNIDLNLNHNSDQIYAYLLATSDSLASKEARTIHYLAVDVDTSYTKTYAEQYNLGEFLYRLHFFQQIPYIGLYLAGFVALFFVFAIVTGTIVHWKKIIPNFTEFNPRVKLKRLWADAHTSLGIIGLPFQFIYGITGAYFALTLLVLLPANLLYNGDQQKLMNELHPEQKKYEWIKANKQQIPSLNKFVNASAEKWKGFNSKNIFIRNYGGSNMKYVLAGEISSKDNFVGTGRVVLDVFSGKITEIKEPETLNYIEGVQRTMSRLHYGDFGGFGAKIVYFILALITCFVIISGVLVWVESRNKKNIPMPKRIFTANVGHVYMAICLSMLPVIALSFLFVKITNGYFIDKQNIIYLFYISTWIIAIVYFRNLRNNYKTNKICLLIGGVLSLLIPIANGISSNNWIWNTFLNKQSEILLIDILWLFIGLASLWVYSKIKPFKQDQCTFARTPIDFNFKEEKLIQINIKNQIPMRTKIALLWIFLALGWVIHHVYGLFNIYYIEDLTMEGATGEAPVIHHIYRILFEGACMLFGLLTLEVSKKWFRLTTYTWAVIAAAYNAYHLVTAAIYESTNYSELFMLVIVAAASILLVKNIHIWNKSESN